MKKANPVANQTEQVDEFLDQLDHPFKAEVQMVRDIIKKVKKDITEKAKSFRKPIERFEKFRNK